MIDPKASPWPAIHSIPELDEFQSWITAQRLKGEISHDVYTSTLEAIGRRRVRLLLSDLSVRTFEAEMKRRGLTVHDGDWRGALTIMVVSGQLTMAQAERMDEMMIDAEAYSKRRATRA